MASNWISVNYSQNNADELVLDISATEQERKTLHDLVYEIAKSIDIPFTVVEELNLLKMWKIIKNGADKISINSSAVKNPNLLMNYPNSLEINVLLLRLMQN